MARDQDRWKSSAVDFRQVLSKPAEASEHLTQAYLALSSFKAGLDAMEEIPSHLQQYYKQALRGIDEVVEAQRQATQLRMMIQRYRP